MLATLIALLVTTGLRISEALALNLSDVDSVQGVLRIRRGKYGKARDVPILSSTVDGLR
jgi:integrase